GRGSGRRLRDLDVKLVYRHSGEMVPPLRCEDLSLRQTECRAARAWWPTPDGAPLFSRPPLGGKEKPGRVLATVRQGGHNCPRGKLGLMSRITSLSGQRVHLFRPPRYADPALESDRRRVSNIAPSITTRVA